MLTLITIAAIHAPVPRRAGCASPADGLMAPATLTVRETALEPAYRSCHR